MKNRVVFAACDIQYYHKYAEAFVKSAMKHGETPIVAIVFDNVEQENTWDDPLKDLEFDRVYFIADEYERVQDRRVLYACSRFLMLNWLEAYKEVLILDIDSVFLNPVDWSDFEDCDYSLFLRDPLPNTNEWETEGSRVAAGAVYFTPTVIQYFHKYMHGALKSMGFKWFIDQRTLYAFHTQYKNSYSFKQMPKKYIEWDEGNDCVIWTAKGPRKNSKYFKELIDKYL